MNINPFDANLILRESSIDDLR